MNNRTYTLMNKDIVTNNNNNDNNDNNNIKNKLLEKYEIQNNKYELTQFEKQEFDVKKNIYTMLVSKIIDMVECTSCFGRYYIKYQWNAYIKSLLWVAQRTLSYTNKNHICFLNKLEKNQIGNECNRKDLDYICVFVFNSIDVLIKNDKQIKINKQNKKNKIIEIDEIKIMKFVETFCIEILGLQKIMGQVVFGNIILFDSTEFL